MSGSGVAVRCCCCTYIYHSALSRAGRPVAADEELIRRMDGNKDEAERCIDRAEQYVREKRFDDAEKFLRKAQRLYPTTKAEGKLSSISSSGFG